MSANTSVGEKEASVRRFMRASVVTVFVVVGPLILVLVALGAIPATEVPMMLDIFKIWLGAVVGISTSLLQRGQ